MDWESFWEITGHISDILGIISVVVSVALWISFGRFKKEIERQKYKYIEEQKRILKKLNSAYQSIYNDNEANDAVVSQLRRQLYSIKRNFGKLLTKEDLKCVKDSIKIMESIENMDYTALKIKLDFIITAFTERSYDYE